MRRLNQATGKAISDATIALFEDCKHKQAEKNLLCPISVNIVTAFINYEYYQSEQICSIENKGAVGITPSKLTDALKFEEHSGSKMCLKFTMCLSQ